MTHIVLPLSLVSISAHKVVCSCAVLAVVFKLPLISISVDVLIDSKSMLFIQAILAWVPITMNIDACPLSFCKPIYPFTFIHSFFYRGINSKPMVFPIWNFPQIIVSIVVIDSGPVPDNYGPSLNFMFFNSFCVFFLRPWRLCSFISHSILMFKIKLRIFILFFLLLIALTILKFLGQFPQFSQFSIFFIFFILLFYLFFNFLLLLLFLLLGIAVFDDKAIQSLLRIFLFLSSLFLSNCLFFPFLFGDDFWKLVLLLWHRNRLSFEIYGKIESFLFNLNSDMLFSF